MHNGTLPKSIKICEVIQVYKEDEPYDRKNHWPINILSNLSKNYERYIHDEINSFFDDNSSKIQYGFHKCFSADHCLLYMTEKP